MQMFLHVIKRLALAILGYCVAVLVGLIAVALIYGALSSLAGAPDYFAVMSMSPWIALLAPSIGIFVFMLALVLTAVQSLITTLLSEFFTLRAVWVHMLFGAIVSATGFVLIMPAVDEVASQIAYLELAVFTLGGAVGGVFYWLIAGRHAGFRRPQPLTLMPPLAVMPPQT